MILIWTCGRPEMVYPPVFFIHSVTLRHITAWGKDAGGQPAPTAWTDTVVSCRFTGALETLRLNNRTISYVASKPRIVFSADTVVADGDTVTSTEDGFEGVYSVNTKRIVYEPATKIVSHRVFDIATVPS
jgi:hypothetical protein